MAEKIAPASIRRLVEYVGLAQHLLHFIPLKRTGNNYTGKCPFHADSSPSFVVYEDERHFHCFGCHKHGNIIDFEMHRLGAAFPDAVLTLAERYGVQLEFLNHEPSQAKTRYEENQKRWLQLMEEVSAFYSEVLFSAEGKIARQYLQKRGFTLDQIKFWQLGLAPSQSVLSFQMRQRNWQQDDLIQLGLIRQYDDHHQVDFFRGRILIPIKNERGRVVAFGGRIYDALPLQQPSNQPKYLNSPETPLFSKSKTLFNLSQARASIQQNKRAIVVEGYMDCMALVNAGIHNTVAVLGTALTVEHVKALGRLTPEITISFDSDKAGRAAAAASFKTAFPLNMVTLTVLELPSDVKDPDEFLQRYGSDGFSLALQRSQPLIHLATQHVMAGQTQQESRLRAVKTQLVPVIVTNPDKAQQELALTAVAKTIGLSSYHLLLSSSVPSHRTSASMQPAHNLMPHAALQATEKSGAVQSCFWRVRSLEEFKFITCLLYCTPEDLPQRLFKVFQNLAPESIYEKTCCQMICCYLTESSRSLWEEFRNPSQQGAFSSEEIKALASATQDVFQAWSSNKEALTSSVRNEFFCDNVFEARNLATVQWWFKNLDISWKKGLIGKTLIPLLIRLEVEYLQMESEKARLEAEYALSQGQLAVVEELKSRRMALTLERTQRQRELTLALL